MERKLNLNTAVKWWQPEYQHSSVFSSLGHKGLGSKASKLSSKTSSSMMSRKREALALAQLKICQLKVRQRLDEEEHEIRRKRESMEAEMEAEKAAVSLKIYEEEEIGEEGRDMELVISHDKEHWQPPKLHGVTEPRGTSEPFTMDRTPSLKPQVPTIPSMSTTNYLNETVSGSFLPHPKQEALVVPISSCNSAQPNGYATLQPVSRLSSCKQLRFTSSLDKPASGSVSGVTSSVTPTSNTVTSSLTVPVIQPWELQHTTSRLPSRDSKPLLVDSVVSSIKSSQPLYELLDNGSEMTLCHERLAKKLKLNGDRLSFTLTGMTGSAQVESCLVDLVMKSLDEPVNVANANFYKLYCEDRRPYLVASSPRH